MTRRYRAVPPVARAGTPPVPWRHELPRAPAAAAATHARAASPRARDPAARRRSDRADVLQGGIDEPVPISPRCRAAPARSSRCARRRSPRRRPACARSCSSVCPPRRTPRVPQAWHPDGIGQRAIAALREEFGDDAVVMSDLCLDEHRSRPLRRVERLQRGRQRCDARALPRIAHAQADAGAHVIGPSGMMDGQVGEIREALDVAGRDDVAIMAYAAKFASALYGPFREAAEGAPRFGDRMAISRIRRTPTRPCARSGPTSTRAPTS